MSIPWPTGTYIVFTELPLCLLLPAGLGLVMVELLSAAQRTAL